ncbi:hypothetical protein HNR46_002012 [Haloferula luteola]|uniref:Uncharacterized protein n=1 Tax=Haloferula luteola TaxID=595692 RepID=A0A840V2S3_9BACT|nr:hypothetical protein [Haloferula luteola]MBB5351773.1 hypothetical protein [Haloferula luteola]
MKSPVRWIGKVFSGIFLVLSIPSPAQVECWAPGMDTSTVLQESTRYRQVSLGRPYRYDVFGVAGRLTLGGRALNAAVMGGKFHPKVLGLVNPYQVVNSDMDVILQTGLLKYYPERLHVSGNSPGTTVGPVQIYGERWTLCDPRHPADVNLAFHLTGSSLLGSVLDSLLSSANYNLNPEGYFYVLGECHLAPPKMEGRLAVAADTALYGSGVEVVFEIDREYAPVYRPPFLGLDLGDVNLTVLGTPPSDSGSDTGMISLPEVEVPDLVQVTIDLSGLGGAGWSRRTAQP